MAVTAAPPSKRAREVPQSGKANRREAVGEAPAVKQPNGQDGPQKVDRSGSAKQNGLRAVGLWALWVLELIHKNEGAFVALFTLTLTVVTGFLVRRTRQLWEATNGLLRFAGEQAQDMKASIAVARQSADAAEQSANAMVDSQRPWVGPKTVGNDPLTVGSKINAWVVLNNTGNSPAQEMRVLFCGCLLPQGKEPEVPDTSTVPQKAFFSTITDYYYPFAETDVLSQETLDALRDGIRVAWIIGRVDYLDGRGFPRHTNICTRLVIESRRQVFIPHSRGNDAT